MAHFRPDNGYVGDVIPFARGGRVWLFYLLDTRGATSGDDHASAQSEPAGAAAGMPWALVSTTDFVHYTDHGTVLASGGPDAVDYDCYTGSVVDDGTQLHLFYTGHNPRRRGPDGDLQVVCHAISDGDPTRWIKQPEDTFGALDGYALEDWRDPFVYRITPDGPWQMVLAARHTDAPYRRSGLIARLTSTDLKRWSPATPLWDPRRFIAHECPDVFQWGDWWYLVYSEFSDAFVTRYRIGRSPQGPWLAPERDTVDGRAFYAAKSVMHQGRRFFIGWIASREDERDDGAWQWAGDMAVLEATQEPDGTLAFKLPTELRSGLEAGRPITLEPVGAADSHVGAGAQAGHAVWIGSDLPQTCLVTVTLRIAPGTHGCGLLLRASDDGETAYVVRLEPLRDRVVLDRWPRSRTGEAQWEVSGDRPFAVELERPCPLPPAEHTIEVLLDDSLVQVVVDSRVTLSGRLYDRRSGRLGLFVTDGAVEISSVTVHDAVEAQ